MAFSSFQKRKSFVGEKPEHFTIKNGSQLLNESVHLPAVESYAPVIKYIINSCASSGCNKDVDRFRVVLPTIDGIPAPSKTIEIDLKSLPDKELRARSECDFHSRSLETERPGFPERERGPRSVSPLRRL